MKGTVKLKQDDLSRLSQMKDKIDNIENCIFELRELGNGMPVVEKNVRSMLSFTYILKCGISDVVEITDKRRR